MKIQITLNISEDDFEAIARFMDRKVPTAETVQRFVQNEIDQSLRELAREERVHSV